MYVCFEQGLEVLCVEWCVVSLYVNQPTNHISLINEIAYLLCKVTCCTGHVSAKTRPLQLRWHVHVLCEGVWW